MVELKPYDGPKAHRHRKSHDSSSCEVCNALTLEGGRCILSTVRQAAKFGCKMASILYKGIMSFRAEYGPNNASLLDSVSVNFFQYPKLSICLNPNRAFADDSFSYNFPSTNLEFFIHNDLTASFLETMISDPHRVKSIDEAHLDGKIALDPKLEDSFEKIKLWIEKCSQEHSTCGLGEPPLLPSRIIDVGLGKSVESSIKLRELSQLDTKHNHYTALSHCWGGGSTYMTTSKILAERLDHIKWDELPEVYRDAITVTRKLGIPYIWIDSLCILQDSRDDWEKVSICMAEIYQKSFVTIAATASGNDNVSFLRKRRLVKFNFGDGQMPETIIVRETIKHQSLFETDPLSTRGWAYQERLMPSRLLSYRHQEFVWECREACWHECGRSSESGGYFTYLNTADRGAFINALVLPYRTYSPLNLLKYWYGTVVAEYSRLHLTYEIDRLPALAAVAQVFQSRTGHQYLAGLWEHRLELGLAWCAINPYGQPTHSGRQTFSHRAPSWTWASVLGAVGYDSFLFTSMSHEVGSLVGSHCPGSNLDSIGHAIHGSVTLSAPIIPAKLNIQPIFIDGTPSGLSYSITLEGKQSSDLNDFYQIFYPDAPFAIDESESEPGAISTTATTYDPGYEGKPNSLCRLIRCHYGIMPTFKTCSGEVKCVYLFRSHDPKAADLRAHGPYITAIVVTRAKHTPDEYDRLGLLKVYEKWPCPDCHATSPKLNTHEMGHITII